MKKKISFVIPIYNEEKTINELYKRLDIISKRVKFISEIIFINDGSKDNSLQVLHSLNQKDERICYINFARNFGHQIAVTAGLNYAKGDIIVVLDGDLQDPPELVLEMIEKWQKGYEVVYAKRTKRKKEGFLKRIPAFLYYRILKKLADIDIPTDTGDFCLMDRCVVDALNCMPERNRYIRGLRAWVGFKQTSIEFEREPRFAGEVKYTFIKSFSLAINGLVSFSKIPLRISTYMGLLSAFFSLFMIFWVIYFRLNGSKAFSGYTIIMIVMFFLTSIQMISIGILGEYIGRIYEETKNRPLYTISSLVGFDKINKG